ncbi:MAG TPA: hypothetical protein VNQ76_13505 [Planctomicrobium sp.]|nr:hypothetical protein [Planctomicrobium sp.]
MAKQGLVDGKRTTEVVNPRGWRRLQVLFYDERHLSGSWNIIPGGAFPSRAVSIVQNPKIL